MREFSGLLPRRKFNSFNWFKLTIMNKKEALIRCLRTAAWLLIALIPVIAGIILKEGNGSMLAQVLGWLSMADGLVIVVAGIIMARKRKEDGLV